MNSHSPIRLHRLRQWEPLRALIRETRISLDQLVMPLFVRPGKQIRSPIASMPGQFQLSVDQTVEECRQLVKLGIRAVLLFGLAEKKDERASRAYAKDGLIQKAIEAIKEQLPDLLIITDVCLCAYMSHGHCGVLKQKAGKQHTAHSKQIRKKSRDPGRNMPVNERDWWIDNDATLELLSKTALSHAQAGADLIAPSDMMDGNVGAIRQALDAAAFEHIPIMAYSTKYASSFYGPFRNAVDSTPQIGDRRSYQMDPANSDEAIRKALRDIEEGADILMVKPALAYLDIIRRVKQELNYPVAAFNVSGEYALVKAAASRGWIAERPVWMEILLSIKRAGADILITYWAKEAAKILGKSNV